MPPALRLSLLLAAAAFGVLVGLLSPRMLDLLLGGV